VLQSAHYSNWNIDRISAKITRPQKMTDQIQRAIDDNHAEITGEGKTQRTLDI
jgi:hypothetical protein